MWHVRWSQSPQPSRCCCRLSQPPPGSGSAEWRQESVGGAAEGPKGGHHPPDPPEDASGAGRPSPEAGDQIGPSHLTALTSPPLQLVRLLETAPGRALELSLWLRHLLTQHSSYLMTQPQLVSLLSSFYQVTPPQPRPLHSSAPSLAPGAGGAVLCVQ